MFLLSITLNYVVSVCRGFLFLLKLRIGCCGLADSSITVPPHIREIKKFIELTPCRLSEVSGTHDWKQMNRIIDEVS